MKHILLTMTVAWAMGVAAGTCYLYGTAPSDGPFGEGEAVLAAAFDSGAPDAAETVAAAVETRIFTTDSSVFDFLLDCRKPGFLLFLR